MKSTKSFIYICAVIFLSIALLITGCGGGGGGNSVGPEPDPTEIETFSKKVNTVGELYSETGLDTKNIAVDVAADNSDYIVNITNNGSRSINIKVSSSNANADTRMSMAEEPQPDIGEWIYDPNLMARRMFAEAAMAHQSRAKSKTSALRASSRYSVENHKNESVGNEYTIQVGTVDKAPLVVLKKCKLVKITDYAKFFVDQDSHGGYLSRAAEMEQWLTSNDGVNPADLYDKYMYGVLSENYGTVADVDGDGKLSVLITSILPSWQSGLEGLFPEETMILDPDDYDIGITDFRDLVLIAPPADNSAKERHTMISNLIHETQHAVNFSQRAFSGNTYKKFNATAFAEELGFDEGCSVCAEALFRRAMGAAGEAHSYEYRSGGPSTEYAGNTSKFNSYSISNVFPFDSSNFGYGSDYGRNGLFVLYIHDRFEKDKDSFKKLIQQGWQGRNLKYSIPEKLGCKSLDELQEGWHLAMQNESLRNKLGRVNNAGENGYADWLNLNINSNILPTLYTLDNISKPLKAGKTLSYCFQAKNNADGNFRFFIKSADEIQSSLKDLSISIIKVTDN